MKCPCCGAAELIHDTRDVPYIYNGDATTILAVKGDFCPACGEVVLNKSSVIVMVNRSGSFNARSMRPMLIRLLSQRFAKN